MDKNALIDIINSLLTKQPELRNDIMYNIPAPTISSSISVLNDLEKKFVNSFPFNKNGNGRDAYTFSRVRENLTDFIVSPLQNCFFKSKTNIFFFLGHYKSICKSLYFIKSSLSIHLLFLS